MNKPVFLPIYLFFIAMILILTLPLSGYAKSETETQNSQIDECINQGRKHIQKKYAINRVIKSFDSQIPSSKKYEGFLISVHKNLTYAILVCGNPNLNNFQIGVFDEEQKGVKGAKSHALKGAWISLLTWEPDREGAYLVVVFSKGGEGEFSLSMMAK